MTTAEEIHDQQDKNWRFMVARASRFEAALKEIRDRYLGDCPWRPLLAHTSQRGGGRN